MIHLLLGLNEWITWCLKQQMVIKLKMPTSEIGRIFVFVWNQQSDFRSRWGNYYSERVYGWIVISKYHKLPFILQLLIGCLQLTTTHLILRFAHGLQELPHGRMSGSLHTISGDSLLLTCKRVRMINLFASRWDVISGALNAPEFPVGLGWV